MSFSVPFLEHVDYIGWDSWIKRLLSVSFMAPIFMFFMYFIFLLLDTNPFKDFARTSDQFKQRPMETVLMLLIPTLIILILLLYATKFAKKSSGVLGEKLTAGLKTVGGFALGAATGGLAVAGTASFGRMGAAAANSKGLKDYVAKGGFGSEIAMRSMEKLGSGSFDLRGVKVAGMSLGSATGMNLGEARKGGFKQRREEQVKKRQERAKDLEVGADEDSMKAVRKAEAELQEAKTDPSVQAQLLKLNEGTHDDEHGTGKAAAETALNNAINNNAGPAEIAALEKAFTDFKGLGTLERESAAADRELAAAERNLRDVINKNGANSWQADHARGAQALVEEKANKAKSDLTTRQIDIRGAGHAIHAAEVNLREKESIVTGINKERRINYAKAIQTDVEHAKQWILTMGQYSTDGAREAADLIRANAKIGGGGHVSGGGHGGRPAPTAHAPAPTHTPPPAPAPAGGGGAHTPAAH